VRRREEEQPAAASPKAKQPQRKVRPSPQPSRRPSELELLEQEVVAREREVAQLERRLAEDWGDLDAVAAHRRAREELQAALGRWEELFERSQP
jgi:hypothetical protein